LLNASQHMCARPLLACKHAIIEDYTPETQIELGIGDRLRCCTIGHSQNDDGTQAFRPLDPG
jgi:hypothetical protein